VPCGPLGIRAGHASLVRTSLVRLLQFTTTREHTHEPRHPRGSRHCWPHFPSSSVPHGTAKRPPSSIGYPGRWRADHTSLPPAFAVGIPLSGAMTSRGSSHPETKGCTLCVSSPPRKRSSTCVAAWTSQRGWRLPPLWTTRPRSPSFTAPRRAALPEGSRCFPSLRSSRARWGLLPLRPPGPALVHAAPMGHCSGGQRLFHRPA
jgi:hypothetical protein